MHFFYALALLATLPVFIASAPVETPDLAPASHASELLDSSSLGDAQHKRHKVYARVYDGIKINTENWEYQLFIRIPMIRRSAIYTETEHQDLANKIDQAENEFYWRFTYIADAHQIRISDFQDRSQQFDLVIRELYRLTPQEKLQLDGLINTLADAISNADWELRGPHKGW
ncbi:hypothetical protein FRB99_002798 [Tulasnella sp. 403]|nr:hypothetical protein FRB99_002798 [Tulasnella sp. 403]